MMSRRQFLVSSASLAVSFPVLGNRATPRVLGIGLVADAQYADQASKKTRFYRNSRGKLGEAVREFNRQPLEFCVNLGDWIDRDAANYGPALAAIKTCQHPFRHVLGNHDFVVADDLKKRVPKLLGLRKRYYAINCPGFCFVMLDTNEVSVYAYPEGTREHAEGVAELERLKAANAVNAQTWNGGVGADQLEWLERTCQKAGRADRRVVVFAHHPVFPQGEHNVWNDTALLKVMARHRNVVAWINGHNHAGHYGEYEGVCCLTLKGMVETADTNAFAIARFHNDRLELTGYGREPSREFRYRRS